MALTIIGVLIAQLFRLQHTEHPNKVVGFFKLGIPLAAICIGGSIVVLALGAYRFWRQQNAMLRGKIHAGGWEINAVGGIVVLVRGLHCTSCRTEGLSWRSSHCLSSCSWSQLTQRKNDRHERYCVMKCADGSISSDSILADHRMAVWQAPFPLQLDRAEKATERRTRPTMNKSPKIEMLNKSEVQALDATVECPLIGKASTYLVQMVSHLSVDV